MLEEYHSYINGITQGINNLLKGKEAKPIETEDVPRELTELITSYNKLVQSMTEILNFILPLSAGNLNLDPPRARNIIASPFKELHSQLRHLVWQAKQVAQGDYKQRIDFMGDFSEAFNSMVQALEEKDKLLHEQITQLTLQSKKLRESELRYRTSFKQSTEGILVLDPEAMSILETNEHVQSLLGYSNQELSNLSIHDLFEDLEMLGLDFSKIFTSNSYRMPCNLKRIDGTMVNVELSSSWAQYDNKSVVVINIVDQTEKLRTELALKKSEEQLRLVLEGSNDGFWDWYIKEERIHLSRRSTEILNLSPEQEILHGSFWNTFIHPEDLPNLKKQMLQHMRKVVPQYMVECRIIPNTGGEKWVLIKGKVVSYDSSGKPLRMTGILSDITSHKKAENRLEYLSIHDSLTKLHNRTYFEQILDKIQSDDVSLGIAVCDVDGLKLINDSLGHDEGDKILIAAAEILHQASGPSGIVSRIGGDEFTIILPEATLEQIQNICQNIKILLNKYNEEKNADNVHLSISVGFALSGEIKDVRQLFKEADNQMYRDKLLKSQSVRSNIAQTIMQMLKARDYITEGHVDRVADLVNFLGIKKELSQSQMSNLLLLAKFHDIGKVGIPDAILNKPGLLTEKEWILMRNHSDIGRRICLNISELSHIADLILKHHEWWNGSGYPLGLKGEEIPVECRILAIVDAYDAMTNDRPYRKALSTKEAIQELLCCAGVQFDPDLVKEFVDLIKTDLGLDTGTEPS